MTTTISIASRSEGLDACWNRIGVSGDQSCEKLEQHVHCRNCEVYASAAQRNLQRPVDAGYKQEWASHFRQSGSSEETLDASSLIFRIGAEWLCLPTNLFVTVAPQSPPHRLPHREARGLLGIVNVGGRLYPCMSLAALLGIDGNEQVTTTGRHVFPRLLVMQWEGQEFALPVADLHGIVRYASSAMQAPAATINKGLSRYLLGVITQQEMRVGVLDAALIGHQFTRTLR
jgi:chemotaxis-related protein WspD